MLRILSLALITLFGSLAVSQAQTGYPNKPVHVIIPAPAGGSVDTIARSISAKLADALGQPFVPENRPGAGTMIGSELEAKAKPDGYTILFMTSSHTGNAALRENLPYDPIKDFSPLTLLAIQPYVIITPSKAPSKTLKDFIALAKKEPGKLNFSSAGTGSGSHLTGVLFAHLANINIVHVPYDGGAPATTAVVNGEVQLNFGNLVAVKGLADQGALRILGISSEKRNPQIPDVPTAIESGVPDYVDGPWYGVLLPAHTPPEVMTTLRREILKALNSPDIHGMLTKQAFDIVGNTPEEFTKFMVEDIAKWKSVSSILPKQ